LDHVFVTRPLANARLEIVHRNVDLPAAEAVSDHDPVLVDLALRAPVGGSHAGHQH
jgi:endonuclease/exonuclease/phosphatase family metal-dependent hydrolase